MKLFATPLQQRWRTIQLDKGEGDENPYPRHYSEEQYSLRGGEGSIRGISLHSPASAFRHKYWHTASFAFNNMLHMFSSLYSKQIIYYHQPKELIKIGVYHLLFCEQKVTFPSLVWSLAASLTGCEVLQLVQLGTAETWSFIKIL